MFTRAWNLFLGFINRYIMSIEVNNPEVVYDNAIESMLDTYQKLKGKAGAVKRQEADLAAEKKATEDQLKKVTESLDAAANLREDQVDLVAAAEMVNLQSQLVEKLNGLNEDYAVAREDSKEIVDALLEVESELRGLKAEKGTNIGRFQSAKARMEIMDMQNGTSISAARKSLEGVRDTIKNTIAEAKLSKDMQNSSLESKVRQFQKVTESQSAKDKFLQLRAAAQQNALGSGSATPNALDAIISDTSAKTATSV